MCNTSLKRMVIKKLLLIKMKKIQLLFTATFILSILMYLLSKITNGNISKTSVSETGSNVISYHVHVFYDGGFRNEKVDGQYKGWFYYDTKLERKLEPAYYPSLGLYSSNDPMVIDTHMKQIRDAGIGVVVVAWWPQDYENMPPMSLILQYAEKYDLKVSIHIPDYENRTINTIRKQLWTFFHLHGQHPALYKTRVIRKGRPLPMIYIHELNQIPYQHWNAVFGYASNYTLRGTNLDAIYIGLLVDDIDKFVILNSGFDGFFTFVSFQNHTYGSTWYNWPEIQDFAREHELVFIPTINPGYDDRSGSSEKPYRSRHDGVYYMAAWTRAIVSRSKFVAINSFNGWLHGTQIEPAQPKTTSFNDGRISYDDYGHEGPYKYLTMTRSWVTEALKRSGYRVA